MSQTTEETTVVEQGAFMESLIRNNSKIRKDRAEALNEDTQTIYKRTIEDIQMEIKKMERERLSMLDLSPTTAQSLVLASDFDSKSFVEKDIDLGIRIRNSKIKLEIATLQYKHLFGNI